MASTTITTGFSHEDFAALDKDNLIKSDVGVVESFSYWRDAWLRFKANKKALYSLYVSSL